MLVAETRVHDQVNILAPQQRLVVAVGVTLIFCFGALTSAGDCIRDGHDLEPRVRRQINPVNVPPTAPLSDDTHPNRFHCPTETTDGLALGKKKGSPRRR